MMVSDSNGREVSVMDRAFVGIPSSPASLPCCPTSYRYAQARKHRKAMKKPKKLKKLLNKGFRGYPVATIAYYGPDDRKATKVSVGIVPAENAQPSAIKRWFSEDSDTRMDRIVNEGIVAFIKDSGGKIRCNG